MSFMALLIITIVGILLLLTVYIFNSISVSSDRNNLLQNTLFQHNESLDPDSIEVEEPSEIDNMLEYLNNATLDKIPDLGIKLQHAGIQLHSSLYIAMVLGSALGVGFIVYVLFGQSLGVILGPISPIGAMLLVILGFYFHIEFSTRNRIKDFDEQFGVALEVLATAMRAGNTFSSSLRFIAETMDAPLGTEFQTIAAELNLGLDLDSIMDRMTDRLPSKNLFLFSMAIKVANMTGAGLAPTFMVLGKIITERFRLQGLINIAISENLGSIIILAIFPWVAIPFLVNVWPEAYEAFLSQLYGQIFVVILFIVYCIGIVMMYRTVMKIDA